MLAVLLFAYFDEVISHVLLQPLLMPSAPLLFLVLLFLAPAVFTYVTPKLGPVELCRTT